MKPNFELIRRAAEIIDGVPDKLVNLDVIKRGSGCDTVACWLGWLGENPEFNALGLANISPHMSLGSQVLFKGECMYWDEAAPLLFKISKRDALELFGSSVMDGGGVSSHKAAIRSRVRRFLRKHYQPINPDY